MTYEKLMLGCITSVAGAAARDLCYLHGFETEATQDDIEYIENLDLDIMEMGGC